ncbi:DUF6328 family protein [Propionicimonas sp.]|uniref:DUF6328 family protein n=1 Tax=Propionicimonas sp. TaxID=1955623 RepID=UPI0039E2EC5C
MLDPNGPEPERDETPAERSDRNWNELLQELRVTQTGLQILSGFLLAIPFQARFSDLDPVMVGVYLAAVGFATLATILVVAPVPLHRSLFRQHVKHRLVDTADAIAKAGIAALAVTVVLVAALVFGFVAGPTAAVLAAAASTVAFTGGWLVLPLTRRRWNGTDAGPHRSTADTPKEGRPHEDR